MKCETGKEIFPTKLEAETELEFCKKQRSKGDISYRQTRVYKCDVCKGFHLTSLENRNEPKRQNKTLKIKIKLK